MCDNIGSWSKSNPRDYDSIIYNGSMMLNLNGPDDKGYETIKTSGLNLLTVQIRLTIIDLKEGKACFK